MASETIHEYLLRRLDFAAGQHSTIAREAGIGQATISRIYRRECVPRLDAAQRLIDWFAASDRASQGRRSRVNPGRSGAVVVERRGAATATAAVAE